MLRRGLLFIIGTAIATGACSLFTNLGGFDEGAGPDASIDARAADDEPAPPPSDAGSEDEPFVTPDAAIDACPTATPADGLVAFYPLDEGQGTTVTDCSRSGLHGTLLGVPSSAKWVPGRSTASGTALDFDGNGACFDMGPAPTLDFAGKQFTVSAWVKVRVFATTTTNLARTVISREALTGGLRGWHLGTDDPSSVELDVVEPDGGQREIATPIAGNQWTHVAATYDGALKIYVNGSLSNQNLGPHALGASASGVLRLGCKKVGEKVLDGVVDDVRVYSRVLTVSEIAVLAQP